MGEQLLQSFWDNEPALKQVKDWLENVWENVGNKKYIIGLDRRRLYSRSQHSLINLLFQSAGAIIMDWALVLLDSKFAPLLIDEMGRPYYRYKGRVVKRIGYWHDETEFECEEEIAEEVAEILEWAMSKAGEILKLKIVLAGEAKIGNNWCDVH